MSESWELSGRLSRRPSPLTAARYVPPIGNTGIRPSQQSTNVSRNPASMERQNAGEDSGSQTTQDEEEGKFTMTQQNGKSKEERILLEKSMKRQSPVIGIQG